MSKNLISQLKNLKNKDIAPNETWIKENRAVLLSQIKNNLVSPKHTVYENFWIAISVFFGEGTVSKVVKPLVVFLVVAMVGTSGWIATVDAAYESLPGDLLYNAKRIIEKTQITAVSVLGNKDTEAKLHAEFAKRRAKEIKKVSVSSDPKKIEKVAETVKDLKNEMNTLNIKLEENKQVNLAIDTLKEVKKSTDQVKNVLTEIKEDILSVTSSTNDKEIVESIASVRDLAKDLSVKTVEVVVTKHLEGDVTVSKEEVKQLLNETVNDAINETLSKTNNLVGVNKLVEVVQREIKSIGSSNSTTASVSTSINLVQQLEDIASTTKQAALQSEEVIKVADQKTAELKNKLEGDDLAGVLNIVKEVVEVNKTVEKIVDTAVDTVQLALPPVVNVVKDKAEAGLSPTSTIDVKVIITSTPAVSTTIIVTTTPTDTSTITIAGTSTLKK